MAHGFAPMEFLSSVRRDLGHAFRSLKKDKAFSIVCVVSLGIGMGAIVALSIFGRFMTAPGPGVKADGLAEVLVLPQGPLREKAGEWALEQWSYPDYRALADGDTGMSIAAWVMEVSDVGIKVPDESIIRHATTFYVTPNYFDTFGVTLARGTTFDPAIDDAPNGEPRVIISHEFWKSQTQSDPDIIGKTIPIQGVPHTVIGLTPEGFQGHFHLINSISSLVFLPLERHPRLKTNPNIRDDRGTDWIHVHGRLKPGIDVKTAGVRVDAIAARIAQENPSTNQYKSATVAQYRSLGAAGYPQTRQVLTGMIALAAAVLFVVCLNISGMMMVRGTTRERELSIRSALGAERKRLIQHLFFEALLLAVVAAAISAFVLFGIPATIAWYLGVPLPPAIDFDIMNVVIASGLCLVVSVLFGLMPAVRFSRPSLITAMKDDAGGGGSKTIRVHKIAAMIQVGIAIPFLVISGVMIDRVRTGDLGFETDGLAAARLPAPKGSEQEKSFSIRRVRDNVQQAIGVKSVAIAEGMPVDFDYREFRVGSSTRQSFVTAHVTRIGENFLETLGVPIIKGRTITAADRSANAPVAVISQPLAALLFPDKEPIGEQVTVTLDERKDEQFTVVGVSADFATSQMTTIRPQIMLPMPEDSKKAVQLIVRGAAGDEPKLRAALENALKDLGVEPLQGAVFPGVVLGQDLLEKSLGDLVSEGTAVGLVGGLVLILAALGIIGVVGFMVATRTKEIAVRMALGSTRLKIFRLMMGDIVKLVIPGVAGGILLAAVLIRTLEDVLGTPLTLGHDPLGIMEPVIYAAASAIAISAAMIAGLPAARRATIVQPMVAMRTE